MNLTSNVFYPFADWRIRLSVALVATSFIPVLSGAYTLSMSENTQQTSSGVAELTFTTTSDSFGSVNVIEQPRNSSSETNCVDAVRVGQRGSWHGESLRSDASGVNELLHPVLALRLPQCFCGRIERIGHP